MTYIYGEQIIKVFYISSFIKCRLYGILMVYFDILIIRYIATTSYYLATTSYYVLASEA